MTRLMVHAHHEEFATESDHATIDSWLSARTKWGLWEWTSNAATK